MGRKVEHQSFGGSLQVISWLPAYNVAPFSNAPSDMLNRGNCRFDFGFFCKEHLASLNAPLLNRDQKDACEA